MHCWLAIHNDPCRHDLKQFSCESNALLLHLHCVTHASGSACHVHLCGNQRVVGRGLAYTVDPQDGVPILNMRWPELVRPCLGLRHVRVDPSVVDVGENMYQ